MVANLQRPAYYIAMTFSEREILAGLDFEPNLTSSPEQDPYYLESLQDEKDLYVAALHSHLATLLDLGFSPGTEEFIQKLQELINQDDKLPDFEPGTLLQGSGRGTIGFPDAEAVLFFSNGERVQGKYETIVIKPYYEAEGVQEFDPTRDIRTYGIQLVLNDVYFLGQSGERQYCEEGIAFLPLNPDKLLLHRVITS